MKPFDVVIIELPIDALPDSYAKEQLTKLAAFADTHVFCVAQAGYANDWSAYIGYPINVKPQYKEQASHYTNLTYPAGVLSNGDKLDKSTAEFLFEKLFAGRSYRQ
jgi:hypothetical protein